MGYHRRIMRSGRLAQVRTSGQLRGLAMAALALTQSSDARGAPDAPPGQAGATKTSSLSWVELPGAESCGGAPAVARAVEQRVGRHAIVSPAQADLSIEGVVERIGKASDGGGTSDSSAIALWQAVVTVRDTTGAELGRREFRSTSPDCAELRDSVTLAISLMIDPDAELRALPPVTPRPPTAPAPPSAPAAPPPAPSSLSAPASAASAALAPASPCPAPAPAPAPSPLRPWRVEPSAALDVAYGVLPSAAVGLRVGVAILPPSFGALDIFGGFWGSQTVGATAGAAVRIAPAFFGAAVCPLAINAPARLGVRLCIGGAVEVAQDTTRGFQAPQNDAQTAGQVFVSGAVGIPIAEPVGIRLGAQIGPVIGRNRYVFTDAQGAPQALFFPPALQASGDVGLILRLP
jgi:hypothetical protein